MPYVIVSNRVGTGSAANTTLFLLNFDGNFADAVGNPTAVTGSISIDTTNEKYGSGCGSFTDGAAYVTGDLSSFVLGTDNFTIETWARPSSYGGLYGETILDMRPGGTGGSTYPMLVVSPTGTVILQYGGGTILESTTVLSTAGVWSHLAVERFNGTLTLYIDGQAEDSVADSTSLTAGAVRVGQNAFRSTAGSDTSYKGELDDFRITRGAVYQGNFTPPTGPLTVL